MTYVSVRLNESSQDAIPAIAVVTSQGHAVVRLASGICKLVDARQIAPATQSEVIEYVTSAAKYQK